MDESLQLSGYLRSNDNEGRQTNGEHLCLAPTVFAEIGIKGGGGGEI